MKHSDKLETAKLGEKFRVQKFYLKVFYSIFEVRVSTQKTTSDVS